MGRLMVEVQASHVGVGKTTFVRELTFPWVDDCIDLVESDPLFFYRHEGGIFSNEVDNEKLRAFLVLEHSAASLEQLSTDLGRDWTVVTSRSPLISSAQFSRHEMDWKPFLEFYRKRLNHLKVDRVLVLDYGTSIQADESFLRTAYKRMKDRGRWFELDTFNSFDAYRNFFEDAEKQKAQIVKMYESEPEFYSYKSLPFNDFDETDVQRAKQIISDCRKDVDVAEFTRCYFT